MREFDTVVIGGGPAGITVATDLAAAGKKVLLAERRPFLGGKLSSLGVVFPTMKEGRATALEMIQGLLGHVDSGVVSVSLQTTLEGIRSIEGGVLVDLHLQARHVNERCSKCGECADVCPVTSKDRWDEGMSETTAIRVMHRSWPTRSIIDSEDCTKCGKCLDACVRDAIDLNEADKEETVQAKTVVIASGLDVVDLKILPEFGIGLSNDIITTVQLERLMAAGGPTQGRLMRPSDSSVPKSVVFAQCVGSRVEKRGVRYCCSVGCLNAVKNATLIMERNPGTQAYVCYIDMRMHGRGYEEAYKDARTKGVRFIRGQPSIVKKEGGGLLVCGENTLLKELYEIPAGLVVLCPGLEIPAGLRETLGKAGAQIDDDGLVHITDDIMASEATTNDRIFLAGMVESPKDLKEAILHAQACAKSVLERL
ncbi:MAG: CoB--CoM heterodisulfide reductase iron-sulfur subunit A [Methanomassiliicoccales archaeon PtaU1.Bin124]|nr:MAG: CoB--CoM heterodisulfide reductase iron-sulfur subunit A [Methanomassiliicoccales archaeon PtaU1.Bin124]